MSMSESESIRLDRLHLLQSRFPNPLDAKLVNDLLFLRSAGEDLQSFGKATLELLAGGNTDVDAWKGRVLVQCLDSVAWLGRLTAVYGEAVVGLTIHLRCVAPLEKEEERKEEKDAQLGLGLTDTIERMVP